MMLPLRYDGSIEVNLQDSTVSRITGEPQKGHSLPPACRCLCCCIICGLGCSSICGRAVRCNVSCGLTVRSIGPKLEILSFIYVDD